MDRRMSEIAMKSVIQGRHEITPGELVDLKDMRYLYLEYQGNKTWHILDVNHRVLREVTLK